MGMYLGISQEVWEGIFSVGKVFLPGFILALFTAYYQLRKKREIKLEASLLKVRIQSYERIINSFAKLMRIEAPTLKQEDCINAISEYITYPDLNIDCCPYTSKKSSFDEFYYEICTLQQNERVYLDGDTQQQLEDSVSIFTHCKLFLDAYCDTENEMPAGKRQEDILQKIDFAYMITSIIMKNDFNRAFIELEEVMTNQLRHLRLRYKDHWLKRRWKRIEEPILLYLDSHLYNTKVQNLFWLLMNKRTKMMTSSITQLPEVYGYIHMMDQYSPRQYFESEEIQNSKQNLAFAARLFLNIHR